MPNVLRFNEMYLKISERLDADLLQPKGFRSIRAEYALEKKTSPRVKAGHPTHNGLIVMRGVAMMPEFGE